ncbi:YwiC-like family protein [Nodosilinea sp. P-1105]|uniref:YwiC-like family protein n=1 Tax=Nodosilinea sp. P-1105 TaxID=2546229 RepID=UPI00146E3389|nr:YwiC-like family protein [Nodosilinea sp. P-1105]NMF81751.1 hypothetical protein [Nodosilinea sp. P-1105]
MTSPTISPAGRAQLWYRPTVSPEYGVYVVLAVSFLVGAAAAQTWTWATTLALFCAFLGFQAEHPLVLQIKQRKTWKPRFLVWGGVYGGLAALLAGGLYWQQGLGWSPLLGIYGAAIAALLVDAIAVFRRGQKSILNELITFWAVCLATPLAYVASTGTLTPTVLGLWALCSLYFCCTIFTVKLRKSHRGEPDAAPIRRAIAYHGLATLLVAGLYGVGLLPLVPALAFTVALVKFLGIGWRLETFQTLPIGPVAALETTLALLFGSIVIISALPVYGGIG